MNIEMQVIRNRTILAKCTFGQWFVPDEESPSGRRHFCHTLEDKIREVPGMPVSSWKVYGMTAIPSGRYRLTLEDSPHFGKGTITLNKVEGFDYVRVHSVGSVEDTDGCIGVGDLPDRERGTLSGGLSRGVKKALEDEVRKYIEAGHQVWLTLNNPNII